jgi:hypothetical protein
MKTQDIQGSQAAAPEHEVAIVKAVKFQEFALTSCMENQGAEQDKTFKARIDYERAKLIGMLDLMDALKIDRTAFNWVFTI